MLTVGGNRKVGRARRGTAAAGGLVFDADWGTATGTGASAVTDGGAYDTVSGDNGDGVVLTVIAGSGVGFSRTTNVMQVGSNGTADYMVIKSDVVPLSTDHWGQVFIRNDDDVTSNSAVHSIAMLPVGTIQQAFSRQPTGDGTWRFAVRNYYSYVGGVGGASSYPTNRWVYAGLANDTWYRVAWSVEFSAAQVYRLYPAIYTYNDADPTDPGTLVADYTDMIQSDGGSGDTLEAWYTAGNSFYISTLSPTGNGLSANDFGIGQEGQGTNETPSASYFYYAQPRFSTTGPIGAGA
jgi:hypothetical protein